MNNPKYPVPGELIIDASDVAVTDITPEEVTARMQANWADFNEQ